MLRSPRVLFIFSYNIMLGSFIILYPGGALELKENKFCSRIALLIEHLRSRTSD